MIHRGYQEGVTRICLEIFWKFWTIMEFFCISLYILFLSSSYKHFWIAVEDALIWPLSSWSMSCFPSVSEASCWPWWWQPWCPHSVQSSTQVRPSSPWICTQESGRLRAKPSCWSPAESSSWSWSLSASFGFRSFKLLKGLNCLSTSNQSPAIWHRRSVQSICWRSFGREPTNLELFGG